MNVRIATTAAAAMAILALPALAAQNITKRATVTADAAVDVSNVQGRVNVTAWDRNEVELTAMLESDKDTLEYEASETQVRIKVRRPDGKYGRHYDEDDDAVLTLKVPKGARLTVNTVSADILVDGVRGEQRLKSVSGEVETRAYDQPLVLGSVSGDIKVTGSGGRASVETDNVSGDTFARALRGSYNGESVSGDLSAEVDAASDLRVKTVSGDATLRAQLADGGRVEMESISGTLDLAIKPPVHAQFDVESFSGDIDSCFSAQPRRRSKYGPGNELSFTEGNGNARVRIQTLSGDIDVCGR